MHSKHLNSNSFLQVQLSESSKTHLVMRLSTIAPDTLLGFAFQNFSLNANEKSDEDFNELLNYLYMEMRDNPAEIKKTLGNNYHYFKDFFVTL